jgi:hypothetical protein
MGTNEHNEKDLMLRYLTERIIHQYRWRRINMGVYSFVTILMILCSASASVTAAMGYSYAAAILAGGATVLVSIEKTMLFRERWKLHLDILTSLENLKFKFEMNQISLEDTSQKLEKIMNRYSSELPFEPKA